ncbi:hypothetical protein ACFQX6_47585 [Streptosporangium lutulentum]
MPDRELLIRGRELCGVAHLPSTDPTARELLDQAGAYDWGYSLMNALVFLCPDAVGRTWPELVLSEAEMIQREKDYQVEQTSYCSDPRARPRAHRQATTALFVGEGGGYGISDVGVDAATGWVPTWTPPSTTAWQAPTATARPSSRRWRTLSSASPSRPSPRLRRS